MLNYNRGNVIDGLVILFTAALAVNLHYFWSHSVEKNEEAGMLLCILEVKPPYGPRFYAVLSNLPFALASLGPLCTAVVVAIISAVQTRRSALSQNTLASLEKVNKYLLHSDTALNLTNVYVPIITYCYIGFTLPYVFVYILNKILLHSASVDTCVAEILVVIDVFSQQLKVIYFACPTIVLLATNQTYRRLIKSAFGDRFTLV